MAEIAVIGKRDSIYGFSAQNGKESEKTSGRVTQAVASVVVEDFKEKTEQEQQVIRLRYGLGGQAAQRQREVAAITGISRSSAGRKCRSCSCAIYS